VVYRYQKYWPRSGDHKVIFVKFRVIVMPSGATSSQPSFTAFKDCAACPLSLKKISESKKFSRHLIGILG
jgi:hypothetical protein